MKTHTLLLLSSLGLLPAACGTGGHERAITVQVDGGAGRTLYFDRFVANKPAHVDSVVLDANGKGVLRIPHLPLDIYRVAFSEQDFAMLVLDSAESVSIRAKAGMLRDADEITGSPHSGALLDLQRSGLRYQRTVDSLSMVLRSDPQDTLALTALNRANSAHYDYLKRFTREHQGSPVALFSVSRLDITKDLDLYKGTRDALRATTPRSDIFRDFRDRVDRAEQEIKAQQAQQAEMERLSNLIPVGGEAPDFRQRTPDGREIALSSLRGKVVLIDFWASWCKPCRMENPNVKKVYEKYHRKGFEILGVSLDRDMNAWKGAIEQDGLPWMHVSDLQFWNNAVAQQYGISSIPFTVLVGKDGKVLDKNLRGPALEAKLAELFGG